MEITSYPEFPTDIRTDFSFRLRRRAQDLMSWYSRVSGAYDPAHFEVVNLKVNVPKLSPLFHGYRIVHISDIHYGQWMSAERMAGVAELINRQHPDMVAMTGDFVSYSGKNINGLADGLKTISTRDGAIAVLGNHDHWLDSSRVRSILNRGQVTELDNSVLSVERAGSRLHFAGLDTTSLNKHRLATVMDKLPLDGPAVLLVHEPHFADTASKTKRFSLQLSGHSHGGQVVLPLLGMPFLHGSFKKYCSGRYQAGGMTVYTNRGLGANTFWLRVNCKPEITVIELQAKS